MLLVDFIGGSFGPCPSVPPDIPHMRGIVSRPRETISRLREAFSRYREISSRD